MSESKQISSTTEVVQMSEPSTNKNQEEEPLNQPPKKSKLQKLKNFFHSLWYVFYHVNPTYGNPYYEKQVKIPFKKEKKSIKLPNLRSHMICGFSLPDWSKFTVNIVDT